MRVRLRARACVCGAETHRACTGRVRCFALRTSKWAERMPSMYRASGSISGSHSSTKTSVNDASVASASRSSALRRRGWRRREGVSVHARGREGALLRVRPCSEGGVGCRGSRLARGRRGARTRRRPRAA